MKSKQQNLYQIILGLFFLSALFCEVLFVWMNLGILCIAMFSIVLFAFCQSVHFIQKRIREETEKEKQNV